MNPIDEVIIPHIESNVALNARAVDSSFLAEVLADVLDGRTPTTCPSRHYQPGGATLAARELLRFLRQHEAGSVRAELP